MNIKKELHYDELKTSYQPSEFSFTTTRELQGNEGIINHEDALKALEVGLNIEAEGYNIYVCTENDRYRERMVKGILEKKAKEKQVPEDLCYIYNFKAPEHPQALLLKPEIGKKFKDDMDEFVQFIINELPKKLVSKEAEERRETLTEALETLKEKYLAELSEKAEEMGILVKQTNDGIGFAPLGKDGDIISKDQYEKLSQREKDEMENQLDQLYDLADDLAEKLSKQEEKYAGLLKDIDEEIILEEIGSLIKYLKEQYNSYSVIQNFVNDIAEDLLENLSAFETMDDENASTMREVLPWMGGNQLEKLTKKYSVNLLVDHLEEQGAPIITDDELSQLNLAGKILLDTELNVMHSDFSHIRPGLLHRARGGYLVLHMQGILDNPSAWATLKRFLKTGFIYMESTEEYNVALTTALVPDPIKAKVKVILLGSEAVYEALKEYDGEFAKLLKIKVEFDEEMESTTAHVETLAKCIGELCTAEQLCPVTLEALLQVVDYAHRQMESPQKLPTNIEQLLDLVREANLYANEVIDKACILNAIKRKHSYYKKIEQKIDERIMDHTFLIDTTGTKVGQVNGLAVYSYDSYSFGRPVKITATTYRGKQGIVDIEKAATLSGSIHTKGIHIITGFLGYQFAQHHPLSLSCNICFEQNYGQIDGDSASSAELYAILSSLADVGIKQNIATTGSVNQFGEIQPIGGVNEKIEGFFKICQKRGLHGDEGVMIPWQNQKELMLSEEIIEAVAKNRFHIYVIGDIWEGIEIITGVKAEEVNQKVVQKLQQFND